MTGRDPRHGGGTLLLGSRFATLTVGRSVRMFAADAYFLAFDISPDGRRFVMIQQGPSPPRDRLELVQRALDPSRRTP